MRRTTDRQLVSEASIKPLASRHGRDLLLLDVPGSLTAHRWQGFLRCHREDLTRFLLALGAAALLVLSAWGSMQIGE